MVRMGRLSSRTDEAQWPTALCSMPFRHSPDLPYAHRHLFQSCPVYPVYAVCPSCFDTLNTLDHTSAVGLAHQNGDVGMGHRLCLDRFNGLGTSRARRATPARPASPLPASWDVQDRCPSGPHPATTQHRTDVAAGFAAPRRHVVCV